MVRGSIIVATLSLLQIAVAIPTLAADFVARPTVTIPVGTIVGVSTPVTSASSTTTVFNYLGVPYAAVPTGSLRFAPPITSSTLATPVQATAFPPSCIQQYNYPKELRDTQMLLFNNPGGPPPVESEDCLYLNIFAPIEASPTNKKAVLFWIVGGNLQFATASQLYLNGSSFAGYQDIVVVTFNYRTGIFGYSNSPQIPLTQRNAGFLDQRAALQWVYSNIAKFGGDPDAITIFGESAGGISAEQLMALPPSPLSFRGAIMESDLILFTQNGTDQYQKVAQNFNCSTASSQIDCLRRVEATTLRDYLETAELQFPPAEDNSTFLLDVRDSINRKTWADVPYFIGSNSQEIPPGALAYLLNTTSNSSAVPSPQQFFQSVFNSSEAIQQALLQAYQIYSGQATDLLGDAVSRVLTDFVITCHVGLLTDATRLNGYTNTWRYYYNASFPNLQLIPNSGAYHTSEIPQVFGTYAEKNAKGSATPDQRALSRYMQTAWAKFAKRPSDGPGWVKLGSGINDIADLGGINRTGATLIPKTVPDVLCPIFDPILSAMGLR